MSNKAQSDTTASQDAQMSGQPAAGNLVDLDEKAPSRTNPGELNRKIGQIDTDLETLRTRLDNTNKALQENLDQFNDKDTDLRTQVTQAYQFLGELDSAYKSLSSQSLEISQEIKTVTKRIKEVSQQTDERFSSVGQDYQTLAQRVEELAAKSKQTTQELNKSIKANAKAMQELEQKLLGEIGELATATRERDDSLERKAEKLAEGLNKADEDIRAGQARMLKMQAIDQALEKRADSLEATTAELTKHTRELARSTTVLNNRTQDMALAIAALEGTTAEHEVQIAGLKDKTEQTSNSLFALINLERQHFGLVAASLGLLLLAYVGYLAYNQQQWQDETTLNTAVKSSIKYLHTNLAATDEQLRTTENHVAAVEAQVSAVETQVSAVEQQSVAADTALQDEISTINQKLTGIGDQIDTLDGRMNNLHPQHTFGNGNVIHGPEWLAQQPAGRYVIHLATLTDKQELYKLAERYSRYLQDDLAYMPVDMHGAQGYALVYGTFESQTQASGKLSRMPRYMGRQRPSVQRLETLQHYQVAGL